MKFKRKKLIFLSLLLISIMGIGYSAISSSLKIDSTAKVEANTWNITKEIIYKDGNVNNNQVTINDDTLTFSSTLNNEYDYYNFIIKVENKGTIDASLETLNLSSLTQEQQNLVEYQITYTDGTKINIGDILPAGKTTKLLVRVEYKENITTYQTVNLNNLTLTLKYKIADKSSTKEIPTTHQVDFYILKEDNTYNKTTKTLSIGSILDVLAPTLTGHDFKGWSNKPNGEVLYEPGSTYNDNYAIKLYTIFELSKYDINFELNGGTGTFTTIQKTYGEDIQLPSPIPSKTGYTFKGWSSNNKDIEYQAGETFSLNEDTTLYAIWIVNSYTLTINPNGGTWNNSTITQTAKQNYGTTKTVANPTKTGYTFGGWTTSGTCSLSGTTFTYGAGDCTITANWTANTYNVIYNGNGNTGGSTASSSHTYDVAKNLIANGFSRAYTVTFNHNYTGSTNTTRTATYTFKNWNTNAAGTGTTYTNSESVTNLATSGTFNLYAQWNSTSVTYVPTRTGYTFGGWYAEAGCTTNKAGTNGVFTPASNVTLYAKWTINSYTLTINPNGGTWNNSTAKQTAKQNYGTTKTVANPTRTGYTFGGWTTSGTCALSGTTFTYGAGNCTITAKWTANTYTVAYNGNGNTGGSMTNSTHTYDTAKNLTANAYTKTGYSFSGWSTSANGNVAYTNGQSVTNLATSGTVTLYAKWTINKYTLTFNANNGTVSPTSITQNYGTSLTLPTPTRSGYNFLGWYTATSGGTKRTYTTMPAVSETLYAQWEKITTLKFSNGTIISLSSVASGSVQTSVTLPAGATIVFECDHNPTGAGTGQAYLHASETKTYGSGTYSYTATTEEIVTLQIAGGGPGSNSSCTSHGGTNCPTGWYSGTLTVIRITDASGNEYKFE